MFNFIRGFKAIFAGFGLIIKPKIRRFIILPLLINTVLFASIIYLGASSFSEWVNSIIPAWLTWLNWLIWPVFFVLCLTVVFFLFSIVANLIGSPFNGMLAEQVEYLLSEEKPALATKPLSQEVTEALKGEAKKLQYFILRAIPLFLLFFIPVIQAFAPFIWFLFGAWMLAKEYFDYPMANHGLTFTAQRALIKQKRALGFGFGVAVMCLTLIPIINFIAMPVAVCAATRLYLNEFHTQKQIKSA